jgi:uncharacterized membrane protein YfcA
MLNVLIISNTIFNVFFGMVCSFVAIQFIRNRKKLKQATEIKKPVVKSK